MALSDDEYNIEDEEDYETSEDDDINKKKKKKRGRGRPRANIGRSSTGRPRGRPEKNDLRKVMKKNQVMKVHQIQHLNLRLNPLQLNLIQTLMMMMRRMMTMMTMMMMMMMRVDLKVILTVNQLVIKKNYLKRNNNVN